MKNETTPRPHGISISDRSRAEFTGVDDVECFSDDMAVITTSLGAVTVTGAELKVARLDLGAGELTLEGRIDALEYGAIKKPGLFSRLMR